MRLRNCAQFFVPSSALSFFDFLCDWSIGPENIKNGNILIHVFRFGRPFGYYGPIYCRGVHIIFPSMDGLSQYGQSDIMGGHCPDSWWVEWNLQRLVRIPPAFPLVSLPRLSFGGSSIGPLGSSVFLLVFPSSSCTTA